MDPAPHARRQTWSSRCERFPHHHSRPHSLSSALEYIHYRFLQLPYKSHPRWGLYSPGVHFFAPHSCSQSRMRGLSSVPHLVSWCYPTLFLNAQELYPVPYESINWPKQRNNCHPLDRYFEASIVIKTANGGSLLSRSVESNTCTSSELPCTSGSFQLVLSLFVCVCVCI